MMSGGSYKNAKWHFYILKLGEMRHVVLRKLYICFSTEVYSVVFGCASRSCLIAPFVLVLGSRSFALGTGIKHQSQCLGYLEISTWDPKKKVLSAHCPSFLTRNLHHSYNLIAYFFNLSYNLIFFSFLTRNLHHSYNLIAYFFNLSYNLIFL